LEDNLGICNYVSTWSGGNFLTPENFAELVNSAMGLDLSENDLMDQYACVGRNLEKAFNSLHTDMDRNDDLPPKRFRKEPVQSGPYKGSIIDEKQFSQMLDEFYEFWGWDPTTGLQTRKCLESLGLVDIADQLERQGKLSQE
jgi:aldehyde:ferredoxin oxidoreductase